MHLLMAFEAEGDVSGAREVEAVMHSRGDRHSVHTGNAMLRVLIAAGRYDDALRFYRRVFASPPGDAAAASGASSSPATLTEVELRALADGNDAAVAAGSGGDNGGASAERQPAPNETTRALLLSACERGASIAARDARILAVAAPIGLGVGSLVGRATGLW